MKKVGFVSLGCPKNLVDSEVMMGQLKAAGYEITNNADEAETVVVNTCGFIESAKAESVEAILEADAVVLGPGSLYTSVLPNLLVKEIAAAIKQTKALRMYVCNVMTQPGETTGYKASDHLQALFDHAGPGIVDCALVNVEEVASCLLDQYAKEGACPVEADVDKLQSMGVAVVSGQLVSATNWVRHNPVRLARLILSTLGERRQEQEKIIVRKAPVIESES